MTRTRIVAAASLALGLAACSADPFDPGSNPFTDDGWGGKEDSGYVNLRGVELEVSLEADIEAPPYRAFEAPPELAQFAVTYLREKRAFYLEILAEDATAPDRVEWLVDGTWLTREQAGAVDPAKLTHFRMKQVNAVVMNAAASSVAAGQTFSAKVPRKPYTIMTDAKEQCAEPNSHISLGQSVYWYLWNPDRSGCPQELVQEMTVTIDTVLPRNPESYPEYDKLLADGRIDVVVLFGKLDDGPVADDYNWGSIDQLSSWLTAAGFAAADDAPLGKRFTKQVGDLLEVVDIYGPDLFESVADVGHMANWQKAVSEHEVVMYNGHSVLGTGYAFEEVRYPEHYQIFQVASCLSYEYYVRPVLAGKGSWESVDVLSNVEPTYYHENLPLTSTVLARLFWGAENGGQASWQDIMEAVSRKLGHARFGVSGARDNCFTPTGSRCGGVLPDPEAERYENATPVDIPDDAPAGATSTIEIPDATTIGSLEIALDVTHSYVGDLEISVTHDGVTEKLWSRQGGSMDDIQATFQPAGFVGTSATGTWTLQLIDTAAVDAGRLNRWSITIRPAR